MSKRFVATILTIILVVFGAAGAAFYAKGYRISPQTGDITGTGILSITSIPDQASIYLDGHLTSATNTNINSLVPKTYDVAVEKDGYIPWEKKIDVKEGLVTQVKATLFRSIPSLNPLTYSGVENVDVSPDEQKVTYVVPSTNQPLTLNTLKSGIWVWQMYERPISLTRGSEPHQIMQPQSGVDLTKATFRWSPDSSQLLVTLPDRVLLLDTSKLNTVPPDVTATAPSIVKQWNDQQKNTDQTRLATITDQTIRSTASSSAVLKWAPDETKILYSKDGKSDFKVVDLSTKKTYDMPKAYSYQWMNDSDHLVLVEATPSATPNQNDNSFVQGKISIIEADGSNHDEMYSGTFNPDDVFLWPDDTRLVIVTAFQTATASQPNLYSINLK